MSRNKPLPEGNQYMIAFVGSAYCVVWVLLFIGGIYLSSKVSGVHGNPPATRGQVLAFLAMLMLSPIVSFGISTALLLICRRFGPESIASASGDLLRSLRRTLRR
jgi:hypothetical protein